MMTEIDQPCVGLRLVLGCPLVADDKQSPPRAFPVVLGQHTDEVLAGLAPRLHPRPSPEASA